MRSFPCGFGLSSFVPVRRPRKGHEFDGNVCLRWFQTDFFERLRLRIERTLQRFGFRLELSLEIRDRLRYCLDVVWRASHVLRLFHRTAYAARGRRRPAERRKARSFSTRSEEHTSELPSPSFLSFALF